MVWRTSFLVGGLMMLVTICQMTSSSYLGYTKPEDYAGGYSDSESSSFSIVPWALDVAPKSQVVECGAPCERRQYLSYHAEVPKHPLTTKAYEHRHSVDVPAQAIKDGRPFSYDFQLQVPKKEHVFVGSSYDYKLEVPPSRTEEPNHSSDCELHVPRPKHQPKKYASKYKVTRLAKRKPEAPLRTYKYHVDVPQRKAKETRLTGLVAQVGKQLLHRNCGYRERPDDDCAESYLRGSHGSEEFNEDHQNGYTSRGCSNPAYFTNARRRYHDTECSTQSDYHRRSRTKRATNDENADYDPSTKDYFGYIASEDNSVLPHNEKTFIEKSMPHTSSYSNSEFDYRGIKLGGTRAYSEEYGSRVENINNSSRLSEDMDDLRIENYISARSPTRDHQHTEHNITSHRLPNYSTRYSRFICRNGHHSACEHNKGVLDERKGRFDHMLQTDNPEHTTELPHTTNNPDSFNYTPSDEGKSWMYSVGTQDFSNKGVMGTDSLWEEENTDHKVNYALSRYKNKIPDTEYRLKESQNAVTGLPGVQPKYDEGAGNLHSVDSAREGMRNIARDRSEVPRTTILEDGTGNLKIPGRYVLQKGLGKYDIQNTGHLENQHHYSVQGGTGEDVLDNTNIIQLPPMVHRRIDIVPGYIYPTDNTHNYEEIVFLASPKYRNYATEERYDRNEDVSNNDRSTNRHDVARWKKSQIKRRSSYVHPTKAYSWQHQQIFPIGTKSVQDSNQERNSHVMSPCTESVNNKDISLLKLKNKLFGIQLHRNTQYLDDSDKNGGDLLFINTTTEYFPETYNVNHVKNCKYPAFCQLHEYHDDGLDSEAEEGMGSDQSILYSTNAGNNFQADKKLNHQTYRDLTFIRNDKTIKANSPLILNAIVTSVDKNAEQGTNHQKEHNLKCTRINIGGKHTSECFAAKSDRKYINDQRSKEFLTQEKANIDHHVENLFLPGKYDYVLPLQQNIQHNEGVHNTEMWTQYVVNPDIYTKTGFSYGHFNHHRSDRSSSENIDLEDNLQDYQTYGARGPQYKPQFQTKVAFSPTEKNSVEAREKQSHILPEINEEYFSPQGRALELNNGRFPGNTIDKANLIRPSNRIKEEKTSYEQAVNNLSSAKEREDKLLSSNEYGHTVPMTQYSTQDFGGFNNNEKHGNVFDYAMDANKDDGVLRNLHIHEYNSDHVKTNADPSKEVKNLDYRELNKNNLRIVTEDIASRAPVRFDSYAFLKEEELNPEMKSNIGLKYNTLNADKGFEISDKALLPEKDIKYSQGYDYNSRSAGMNLAKPKFIINRLGEAEDLLSPELSADALQLQIEESMGKMLGKYGHEETNTSSLNNENWISRNKKIDTGMKMNDHSTEKIYLGINSMAEDPEANKIELKNKIQLPYDEDKEGRDTIQYNNYHIPNNFKAVKLSKTKMYYDEDMGEDEKGRSKYESYYIQASAAVPTYNKETTALHEGYKQWQLKNGIFGVPHMGGSTRKCSDGCIQEHRDGRFLKTTETARHSLLGKFTAFNTESVPDANSDMNYSQGPDYNTHSLCTSLGKPKFNINRQEKAEDLSLDLSDDALQLQIEESMSKMLGKNEFTNTNVPSWKNKDLGHMNSKTANDIKLKDYSRERIHTLINPNVDDLKSNKIKFENQIALSCNKKMEESAKAQYRNANNLNVVKPARTKTYYDEEKQNSNPWYRPNYKKPSVVEATTTSCDKNIKASLIKGFPEAVDKSEEYPEEIKEDEWVSVKIHEFPARTHNEYASKRKQKSDNRRTGELEEQTFSGRFYNQRFQPSSNVPLDYKIDKMYPLLGNLNGKERLTAGFENPKAHEGCKGFKFPLVAESKVPPPTATNFNTDMSYKNNFNLASRNDGIVGYNEIKHYRHDNYDDDDDDDYEDYDDDYDYVNDYHEANNADSRLHEDEGYNDSSDKVPFENYHSENFSPNNRHRFYEKFGLKNPEDVTLNDRQTKVSAQKHKGQNIGQYNEHGNDDIIVTHDEELKRFIGGIHYRSQKNNIQTNSPVSKVDKHIWKAKEHQSTSPERGSQSSQDELEYKENSSMENNKPNEYYTSPHIAIKYFPANYHHYEEYYPSEKLNLYQSQGRSQRSPEAYPENDLDSDPELETQIQRPHVLATSSEIQ